jgi:hypothetical protein
MLELLRKAQQLLTNAVNYNLAIQTAFTSSDEFVKTTLTVNGKEQQVMIPTYQNLLKIINSLSTKVNQMQITDDGSDVIQLLSAANNIQLLYLQKRQQYVQPPKGAKIIKFDYETVPTMYSSSSRTFLSSSSEIFLKIS